MRIHSAFLSLKCLSPFHLESEDGQGVFFLCPKLTELFVPAAWGYAVVVTDSFGIVMGVVDPIVFTGVPPGLSPTGRTICGPDDPAGGDPTDVCGPAGRPVPGMAPMAIFALGVTAIALSTRWRRLRVGANQRISGGRYCR
jgi:hypothetical protein